MPKAHHDYFTDQEETQITQFLVQAFNLLAEIKNSLNEVQNSATPDALKWKSALNAITLLENKRIFEAQIAGEDLSESVSLTNFVAKLSQHLKNGKITTEHARNILFTKNSDGYSLWLSFTAHLSPFRKIYASHDFIHASHTPGMPVIAKVNDLLTSSLTGIVEHLVSIAATSENQIFKKQMCDVLFDGPSLLVLVDFSFATYWFIAENGTAEQKSCAEQALLGRFRIEEYKKNDPIWSEGLHLSCNDSRFEEWDYLLEGDNAGQHFTDLMQQLKQIETKKPGVIKTFFKPVHQSHHAGGTDAASEIAFMSLFYEVPSTFFQTEKYYRLCQLAIKVLATFTPDELSEALKMFVPYRQGILAIHKNKSMNEKQTIQLAATDTNTSLGRLVAMKNESFSLFPRTNYLKQYQDLSSTAPSSNSILACGFSQQN